jgi:oxepin-CoA hydrolase/3-oxo-5,6-dehydrosuberyl-CoA semialdehyde dehydrogenase
MLEKCAVNCSRNAAVCIASAQTAFLTEAVVREIIASGILPEERAAISEATTDILDTVNSTDVVTF